VSPDQPLRIVVGEDQALTREGIVHVLEHGGFQVVGTAADAEDLLRKTRAHRPDVVVTDIQMPPTHTDDGLRAAQEIRAELPEIGVLVLSQFLEARYALDLVGERAQGVGYLLKDRVGDLDTFVDAVRRVASGGSALDPDVVQIMIGRHRVDDPIDELTGREREVLALMAEGASNAGIATRIFVSEGTVEKHVRSILTKLNLPETGDDHRRVRAVITYLEAL
jgi:DNA-binding NarL/FixJ family response regulator